MNAGKLLQSLNQLDENTRIEAKLARKVGKSLLETICAFANEPDLGGGWLLLGVAREESALSIHYKVQGVPNPDQLSADLASQCASTFNSMIRPAIRTEMLEDKPVVVVFVPEAEPHDKPVYFKATGLPKGAFRRIGSTDQRCTEDDLATLYQLRQHQGFDTSIVPDASLDDLDSDAIADYRHARAEANPDAEELRWPDNDLLQALKAVNRDRAGHWKPTVAGLLLFGKPVALRRSFPMTRVDYIRVPGREWVPHPDHRFDTVELRAPLLSLLRRTQAAVLDDLPKAFGLEEGQLQRSDKPAIPLRALREALVNALMHRNYRTHAPVQVIRYANRLEIRNPGFSLKSPEHLGEPGSMSRNPAIAAVLHEARVAENKGSGIRAICDAMTGAGLTLPLFDSDRGQDQFTALFFFHHFLGQDDIDWLSRFKDLHLSDAEAHALIVVREVGAIDNATYRNLNKVDTLTASTALRRLRNAGLLEQQDRGPATWYRPTEKLIGSHKGLRQKADGPDILDNGPNILDNGSDILDSGSDILDSGSDILDKPLPGLPESLSGKHSEERSHLLSQLPSQMVACIDATGSRHPPGQMRALVVKLCRLRAWRTEELALLLNRSPETVRQDYLRPLLAEKRIVMTQPDRPKSRQQAYCSVEWGKINETN
jgi:ATP-dependent DNA helicase RecG